ncbi:hypothetical cyanophage protein [Synechococcus phage S-CRM01]|uniref:hypothetical cyanophage protein n=1 Tax=Synechococcus phage S-CRM01 TaxID=1026955 RepID=UPI000209E36C|nr:hypothetical cyanophage protein [Synechococcus phage S-CRM01]AEC53013.1 hypothetical cyanophage protein [Synechococcus phage S-CRM01]
MNRLEKLKLKMVGKSPEYCMSLLLPKLTDITIVPEPDKYYVFVYKAKTPGIQYDQHPFIVCTSIFPWGFIGFNYHWEAYRQYTWGEVLTNLHQVKQEEVETVMGFPLARFKIS